MRPFSSFRKVEKDRAGLGKKNVLSFSVVCIKWGRTRREKSSLRFGLWSGILSRFALLINFKEDVSRLLFEFFRIADIRIGFSYAGLMLTCPVIMI